MRNFLITLFFTASAVLTIQAQNLTDVTFFRVYESRNYNKRMTFYVDDSIKVSLYNYSYFKLKLNEGQHYITLNQKQKKRFVFNTQPDSATYILASLNRFFTDGWPLTQVSWAEVKERFNFSESLNMNKPIIKNTRRVGAGIQFGPGLNDITLGQTTDNQNITLSTGGGFGFNAEAGAEIDKNIDLGIQFGYLSSGLSPQVENASFQFTRFNVGVNLAYIIPIQGGLFYRLKIGGGYNFIFSTRLKFEIEEDISQNQKAVSDTWIYYNSNSFNAFIRYENNLTKRVLLYYTLQYQYAIFEFERGSYTAPTNKLNTPDGQAILLQAGVNYLF